MLLSYVDDDETNCCLYNSGLVIITKHNVVKSSFKPFELYGGFCRLANKGRLWVDLETKDKPKTSFSIINVHLQSSFPQLYLGYEDVAWKQLQSVIDEIKDDLCIIAGDMNISYLHKKDDTRILNNNITFPSLGLVLDHILVPSFFNEEYDIIHNVLNDVKLSDHFPIETIIKIKDE